MTKLFAIVLAFTTSSAFAASAVDLSTQMRNILGDWRIPGSVVFRIEQQSDQNVKVYWCDENTYLNSPNHYCSYSFIKIYQYRSDIDSFYLPAVPNYCAESLQVSIQSPSDLERQIDPYNLGNCSETGMVQEATKL